VWVTLVEAVAIAEQLCGPGTHPDTLVPTVWRYEAGWYRIGVAAGSACPLLTPDGCSVQGSKPNQCQTYPFWPEYLGSPEAWNAEEARCEGIGRGPNRYAAADIMRLLARRAVTREND
jgi:Fe-S-cluster containining protein